jgi:probable addiction module antidote protein
MEEFTEEDLLLSDWDLTDGLDTKEGILAHIELALEDNDIDFLFEILDTLPRAEGMKELACEFGLTREELLEKGNSAILDLLGFRLKLEPKSA